MFMPPEISPRRQANPDWGLPAPLPRANYQFRHQGYRAPHLRRPERIAKAVTGLVRTSACSFISAPPPGPSCALPIQPARRSGIICQQPPHIADRRPHDKELSAGGTVRSDGSVSGQAAVDYQQFRRLAWIGISGIDGWRPARLTGVRTGDPVDGA